VTLLGGRYKGQLVLVCNRYQAARMRAGRALSWLRSLAVTVTQRIRWSDTDQKAIREQLDRILHSIPFQHSPRRQRFLEFIVSETLAGRNIKGYDVALEVFGRPETFDRPWIPWCASRRDGYARTFANIMALTAKAIPFALICRRAHTHRKSSFGTRMLCNFC
jgi:hypothetical protein